MKDKRIHIRSTDMTLAEELHFIHNHIEAIDVSIEGINVELKVLANAVQVIADAINEQALEPDGQDEP